MPRKGPISKRKAESDPKYNDKIIAKFVNAIMEDGKKSLAESLCYKSFDLIKEKTGEDPHKLFKKAIGNVKPMLEVRSRRVGGATFQIPVDVRPERQSALAIRWIIEGAMARKEYGFIEKLTAELIDASKNVGAAIKKKIDTHKMAEANRAFAHYRW